MNKGGRTERRERNRKKGRRNGRRKERKEMGRNTTIKSDPGLGL